MLFYKAVCWILYGCTDLCYSVLDVSLKEKKTKDCQTMPIVGKKICIKWNMSNQQEHIWIKCRMMTITVKKFHMLFNKHLNVKHLKEIKKIENLKVETVSTFNSEISNLKHSFSFENKLFEFKRPNIFE